MDAAPPAQKGRGPVEPAWSELDDLLAHGRLDTRTTSPSEWAAQLGLDTPCTLGDIKRAFRRLAFATHPDRPGGSHEAFLQAQAVLRKAVDAWERGETVSPKRPAASRPYVQERPAARPRAVCAYA